MPETDTPSNWRVSWEFEITAPCPYVRILYKTRNQIHFNSHTQVTTARDVRALRTYIVPWNRVAVQVAVALWLHELYDFEGGCEFHTTFLAYIITTCSSAINCMSKLIADDIFTWPNVYVHSAVKKAYVHIYMYVFFHGKFEHMPISHISLKLNNHACFSVVCARFCLKVNCSKAKHSHSHRRKASAILCWTYIYIYTFKMSACGVVDRFFFSRFCLPQSQHNNEMLLTKTLCSCVHNVRLHIVEQRSAPTVYSRRIDVTVMSSYCVCERVSVCTCTPVNITERKRNYSFLCVCVLCYAHSKYITHQHYRWCWNHFGRTARARL